MKQIATGLAVLVLLVAGTALVPAVSPQDDEDSNRVGVTQFHLSTERSIYIRNGINIRGPFSADL